MVLYARTEELCIPLYFQSASQFKLEFRSTWYYITHCRWLESFQETWELMCYRHYLLVTTLLFQLSKHALNKYNLYVKHFTAAICKVSPGWEYLNRNYMSTMTWRWTQHRYSKLLREVSRHGKWKRKAQLGTFLCLEIRRVYRTKLWAGPVVWSGFSGRTRAAFSASREKKC